MDMKSMLRLNPRSGAILARQNPKHFDRAVEREGETHCVLCSKVQTANKQHSIVCVKESKYDAHICVKIFNGCQSLAHSCALVTFSYLQRPLFYSRG